MQKAIVQVDWYTKVILTLIAVLLAGLLAKPYIVSKPAGAYRDVQEVEVVNRYPIDVRLDEEVTAWVSNWPIHETIPVEIVDACEINTAAYITGTRGIGVITVVDWKEKEAFLKHILKEK